MKTVSRRSILRCEALEARHCMSYTITQVGGNAIATGSSDDTLIVEPNGAGSVTFESTLLILAPSGQFFTSFTMTGVDQVFIRGTNGSDLIDVRPTAALTQPLAFNIATFGGDDVVGLNFTAGVSALLSVTVNTGAGDDNVTAYFGAMSTPNVFFQANLGSGDDTFLADFTGAIAPATRVLFWVHGGTGDDALQIEGTAADVNATAVLDDRLYGDAGDDTIGVDYEGAVAGTLNLLANAGAGADRVDAALTLDAGSTGKLTANVQGMSGNDELTLQITPAVGTTPTIKAMLDGGTGVDAYGITSNVVKHNVEVKLF
jgi:hypothetical protein